MHRETGDWTRYRNLPGKVGEVDFHYGRREPGTDYRDAMAGVRETALEALAEAQQRGCQWLLLTHGASTSRPGQTTARSEIRGLMRSKEATPYVVKAQSIQHRSVFVAAIRPGSTGEPATRHVNVRKAGE